MSTEDKSPNEGTVTYDIRFYAAAPGSQGRIGLILNVEAQSDFYPGYPLVKRGIYYCCRMVSLFSMELRASEKKQILEREFGLPMEEAEEKEAAFRMSLYMEGSVYLLKTAFMSYSGYTSRSSEISYSTSLRYRSAR